MATLFHVPPSLQRRLAAELAPGEQVLWAQMPGVWPHVLVRLPLTLMGFLIALWFGPWFFFFSAHALGFVAEGQTGGTPRGISIAAALFMLPFAALAIGMILAPLIAALTALVSVKVVTDKRYLAVTGGLFPKVETLPGESISSASHIQLGPLDVLVIAWQAGGKPGHDLLRRRDLGLPDSAGAVAAITNLCARMADAAARSEPVHGAASLQVDLTCLPPSLRARVMAALEPGETLLYVGMPTPLRTMRPLLPAAVFAVLWTAFSAIFSIVGAMTVWQAMTEADAKTPLALGLFFFGIGTLFSLIGLAMFSMPFRQLWRAAVTAHAVSDRRLISVTGRPFAGVEIVAASEVRRIERRDHADGRGTLVLGLNAETDSDGDRVERSAIWHGLLNPRAAEAAIAALVRR